MIDTTNEQLLSLREAAASLPTRPHICTVHRWRLRGIGGVKLDTVKIGGRRFTSLEELDRFIAATTAAANGEQPSRRTPRERQRAVEQAEAELAKVGI
jgi:hypothetical protein